MKPEKEEELLKLGQFLKFYSTTVLKIPEESEIHPYNCLVNIINQVGKSKALEGLKQAINDYIEDSFDWPLAKVQNIDLLLKKEGLVTLSELRKNYSRKYKRVIGRNIIKKETEYYMLKGLILDTGLITDEKEIEQINRLIYEYEGKSNDCTSVE